MADIIQIKPTEEIISNVVSKLNELPTAPTPGTIGDRVISEGQPLTSQEMFDYVPDKTEVPVISSEKGISDLNKDKEYLTSLTGQEKTNKNLSEAAKYADTASLAERQAKEKELTGKKTEGTTYTLNDLAEIFGEENGPIDLSGFDKNEDGTYTPNEKGLADLGFTGYDASQQTLEADVNDINDRIENLVNKFEDYNLESDPEYASYAENIKSQYSQIRKDMEDYNKRYEASLETLGYRVGAQRYGGAMFSGIMAKAVEQSANRITDIISQENTAILEARSAFKNNAYVEFSQKIEALKDIREQKKEALIDYNNKLAELNNKVQEEKNKLAEEERSQIVKTNVLDAINLGFSEPLEIMKWLNDSGIDVDVEEITKYTNLVQNQENLAGLDSDYRTFKYLQDTAPEELAKMGIETYTDYIKQVEMAKKGVEVPETKLVNDTLYQYDPTSGTWNVAVGQEEMTTEEKEITSISDYQLERADRNISSVDDLIAMAEDNPKIFGRSAAAPIPDFMRTDAYRNFKAQLETLKANIAFGELTAMREASKTGGALGQVSDREGQLLQSALGALQMSQSSENFVQQLDQIKSSINNWYKAIFEDKYGQTGYGVDYDTAVQQLGLQGMKKLLTSDSYISNISDNQFQSWLNSNFPANTSEGQAARAQMKDWVESGQYDLQEIYDIYAKPISFNSVGSDTYQAAGISGGMRTDRHNSPTAFTTDIAKLAGLKEGVDYVQGDPFSGGKYYTAKLLGNPVDTTIKVIDKIGFYTNSGKPRWTHTAMSKSKWDNLSYSEKKNVIKKMYQAEGNEGALNNYFA